MYFLGAGRCRHLVKYLSLLVGKFCSADVRSLRLPLGINDSFSRHIPTESNVREWPWRPPSSSGWGDWLPGPTGSSTGWSIKQFVQIAVATVPPELRLTEDSIDQTISRSASTSEYWLHCSRAPASLQM